MLVRQIALVSFALASTSNAFVVPNNINAFTRSHVTSSVLKDPSMQGELLSELNYIPGKADTEFARRYGHLAGKQVKTVGQAFADFTTELGYSVNALYKNMVTDLVGTTHLIAVNARFTRDPVWSLGILTSMDLLLKNYPEPEVGDKIVSALFKAVGIDEADVRAEAKALDDWAAGKTKAELEAALEGQGDSPLAAVAKSIKDDEFWMYSRYFSIGLVKLMEGAGIEMDKDEVYPIVEDWMGKKLGKSTLTACADSDLFFKIKDKLDMMETMMKEIEIREKKRMAERLERKAEEAIAAAEREAEWELEVASEKKSVA